MLIRKLEWEPKEGGGHVAFTYIGQYEAQSRKWYLWDRDGACEHMSNANGIEDAKRSCEIHWCDLIKKHFIEI